MRNLLTCLFLLFCFSYAWAGPQGTYLVGETDGEDFQFFATLARGSIELRPFSGGETLSAKLIELRDGVQGFELDWDGKHHQLLLITVNQDEFFLVSDKERTALKGWRAGELPSWLQGEWAEPDEKSSFVMKGTSMLLRQGSKEKAAMAYPLVSLGKTWRMIVAAPEGSSGGREGVLLNFTRVDDNTVVFWDEDDGKVKRFYRKGWL